jgi:hypothetical protein
MHQWAEKFLYRSIKLLLNIKGNINRELLGQATMGTTFKEAIDIEHRKNVTNILNKGFVEDIEDAKKIFHDQNAAIVWEERELVEYVEVYQLLFKKLKMICKHDARKWLKWQVN